MQNGVWNDIEYFFSLCLFQGQNFGSNKRGAALALGEEGECQGERYWAAFSLTASRDRTGKGCEARVNAPQQPLQ